MRVLLIEDNEFISFLYKRQLEKAGIPTDVASTGKEAFADLGKQLYDFILLDMLLPDLNGMDILKHVKTDGKLKTIPVLLLTNVGHDAIFQEAKSLGAIGYLIKDQYSPNEIVSKVKEFMTSLQKNPL